MTKKKGGNKEYNNGSIKCELDALQKNVVRNFLPHHLISGLFGQAGSAKDFMQLYYAVQQVLSKEASKIVCIKPLTTVGFEVGFLSGSLEDKVAPHKQSFIDNLEVILGRDGARAFLNSKKFEFQPATFLRGNTFGNDETGKVIVILSEAQNMTLHELISVTTRVSENSQLLINGDPLQSDIKKSGLNDFLHIMKGVEEFKYLELGDEYQRRSKLIIKINRLYREFLFPSVKPKTKESKWNQTKTF